MMRAFIFLKLEYFEMIVSNGTSKMAKWHIIRGRERVWYGFKLNTRISGPWRMTNRHLLKNLFIFLKTCFFNLCLFKCLFASARNLLWIQNLIDSLWLSYKIFFSTWLKCWKWAKQEHCFIFCFCNLKTLEKWLVIFRSLVMWGVGWIHHVMQWVM